MNKKQLIVTWIVGLFLIAGFILSTYNIRYGEKTYTNSQGLTLTLLNMQWQISGTIHPLVILRNLIRYIPAILIIGGLLIYSLRDKKK